MKRIIFLSSSRCSGLVTMTPVLLVLIWDFTTLSSWQPGSGSSTFTTAPTFFRKFHLLVNLAVSRWSRLIRWHYDLYSMTMFCFVEGQSSISQLRLWGGGDHGSWGGRDSRRVRLHLSAEHVHDENLWWQSGGGKSPDLRRILVPGASSHRSSWHQSSWSSGAAAGGQRKIWFPEWGHSLHSNQPRPAPRGRHAQSATTSWQWWSWWWRK